MITIAVLGGLLMTEREIFEAFCLMMGFERGESKDESVVCFVNDPRADWDGHPPQPGIGRFGGRAYLRGYDDIQIAAQFTAEGKMIAGTVYSHVVAYGPDWAHTLLAGKPLQIISTEKPK